jgi:hypothetical protein
MALISLAGASAHAQLAAEPQSVSVAARQGEVAEQTVRLTNADSAPLTFCVTFERPLQRVAGPAGRAGAYRLAEEAAGGGAPCGEYGEVLYYIGDDDVDEPGWSPYGLTMTPGGRLFASSSSGLFRTFELTPELGYVGWFDHPHVAELEPFPSTRGIGYDPAGASGEGTLWWMNFEESNGSNSRTLRVLLLEGSLSGEPTGRQIEIAPPDAPLESFNPGGVAYDPATDLFYFSASLGDRLDPANWKLWAVDRAGAVPEGYPRRPEPYPPFTFGLPTAYGGAAGGPEGIRVEYGVYPTDALGNDRVVVVDRWGNDLGEALETPVPEELFVAGGFGVRGNPLRSRVDPNGLMYMTFLNFDDDGIVGVRPHPLPPSWLSLDSDAGLEAAWDGVLAPGESREITLTFRAGTREAGAYTSALQAFDAATGEAVVVPLALTVKKGTNAEGEPAAPEAATLGMRAFPNPSKGSLTVAVSGAPVTEALRVVIFDVLGREVAVLHEGPASPEAGFEAEAQLPPGVYVVRAAASGKFATQTVVVAE